MEYRIEVEEHAGQKMVHTYIKGLLSEKDRNRIGAEAIQTMSDNNITKSIWDVREAELAYPLIKVHMAVVNVDVFQFKEGNYVAIIYHHNKTEFEHAKNAAYNRNIFNIAYFESIEEGIAWLAGKE